MEGGAALESLNGRYPVLSKAQLSELLEVAQVADLPQSIIAQIEHLQFRQQLEALDLPQIVTIYILHGLPRFS